MEEQLITTSIPYVNGKPHIGHAFEYLIADAIVRAKRLFGQSIYFSTGTDEYGQKNARTAEQKGQSPREYVDQTSALFSTLLERLNVHPDYFVRTTSSEHQAVAQWLWRQADAAGDLYKKSYTGFYCVGCEEYKQADELDENGNCPIHQAPAEERTEDNYFFRLTKYRDQLLRLYQEGAIKITPDHRRKETENFLQKIEDISVSRSTRSLSWGVPVPGDDTQVMYVWFDALSNYLTAARADHQKDSVDAADFVRWPATLHIVGKDIFRFHTIIWPAMVLSAGLAVPKHVLIHGFINSGGVKMSKSLGNVIDPIDLLDQHQTDAIRYYLLRYIPTTDDGDFTAERFQQVYDADLANTLGNALQRVIVMLNRYNITPEPQSAPEIPEWYTQKIEQFNLSGCLEQVMAEAEGLNHLIDDKKPWQLAKTNPSELPPVLYEASHRLYLIARLLGPFMPETAAKIEQQLTSRQPEPLFPKSET